MMKQILPLFIFLLLFSTISAQTGNKAAEFFQQGMAYKEKNMLREAFASFEKAIAINPNYDSAYLELGSVYVMGRYYDSAVLNFKKAIAINPKMTSAFIALGNLYRYGRPNIDSAFICYKDALKTDTTNKVIYYSLAWACNARQDHENAIPFAVKALDIDNGYRQAYGELGFAYNSSKKYREAIEQFKKNLAISIVDLPLYYGGLAYTALNDKEGALKQYEELKKINEKMATRLKKTIDNMK
jgi:tetratricopeptide (TPR) repeat protein